MSLNLSQLSLAKRSGVSYGTLKKFEQTGKISLESLLKISHALSVLDDFDKLFVPTPEENISSLDDLLVENDRKRGRN